MNNWESPPGCLTQWSTPDAAPSFHRVTFTIGNAGCPLEALHKLRQGITPPGSQEACMTPRRVRRVSVGHAVSMVTGNRTNKPVTKRVLKEFSLTEAGMGFTRSGGEAA